MNKRIKILNHTQTRLEIQKTEYAFRKERDNRIAALVLSGCVAFITWKEILSRNEFNFITISLLIIFSYFPAKFLVDWIRLNRKSKIGYRLLFDKEENWIRLNERPFYSLPSIKQITIDHRYDGDGDFFGYFLKMNMVDGQEVDIDNSHQKEGIYTLAEVLSAFTDKTVEVLNEKG